MTAKTTWDALTGFLTKHIGDLNNVSAVLSELVTAVPLDSQDKSRVQETINAVTSSANGIESWLAGNAGNAPDAVNIRESDIVEALGNFFKSPDGEAAIKNALTLQSTEGKANG